MKRAIATLFVAAAIAGGSAASASAAPAGPSNIWYWCAPAADGPQHNICHA